MSGDAWHKECLTSHETEGSKFIVYRRGEVEDKADEIIDLASGGFLAIKLGEPGVGADWIDFTVFEFNSEPVGQPKDGEYTVLFWGQGPTGNLREMRHSYWGEDGYIFYAPRSLIVSALEALGNWFDLQ